MPANQNYRREPSAAFVLWRTRSLDAEAYDKTCRALNASPHVQTSGSRHANMKEMRFSAAGGEWRLAFAFDPERRAILLVAGDKSGGSARRFYRALIAKADARFDRHLAGLANEGGS